MKWIDKLIRIVQYKRQISKLRKQSDKLKSDVVNGKADTWKRREYWKLVHDRLTIENKLSATCKE